MVGQKGEKMSSSKSNKMESVATITVIIVVVLLIAALFVKMSVGSSSYKSTDEEVSSVDILNCRSNTKIEAFFNTVLADAVEHKITITFNDERPDEISYSVSATYPSKESFDNEGRIWVTDYGLYMGDNNLKEGSINNTFSSSENKVRANFYTRISDINIATAKIFLLNKDNYSAVRGYNMAKFERYYDNLGFNCEKIINKETNEN
ncbi:hypothetical protein IKE13_02330 [Candidatus Saccharibacteria bacterium]|nr:hypothetical protein [Candidatus Saccharibacteria bacterium]